MVGIGLGTALAQLVTGYEVEGTTANAATAAAPTPCIRAAVHPIWDMTGSGEAVDAFTSISRSASAIFCSPEAVAILKRFDRVSPFSMLSEDDFLLPTPSETPQRFDRAHLRGLIGYAAVPLTGGPITIGQQRAVTELLDWSLEVARVSEYARKWVLNSVPGDGDADVLQVDQATFDHSVRSGIDPRGYYPASHPYAQAPAITKDYLADLSARGLSIYVRLGGLRDPGDLVLGQGCDEIKQMTYFALGVPEALRPLAAAAATQWTETAEILASVETIECRTQQSDGDWAACEGEGTIDVEFNDAAWLFGIYPDTEVSFDVGSCNKGYGGCFTERAVLRTADGGTISFAALAALEAAGQPLPAVAGFDPDTRAVVYQTPRQLMQHGVVPSDLLSLAVTDANGALGTLETTSIHRLRVQRHGTERWIHAGALQEGDTLINPDGSAYALSMAGSMSMEGTFALFNLGFGTGAIHNYLVSSDGGQHWFVAHNMKL